MNPNFQTPYAIEMNPNFTDTIADYATVVPYRGELAHGKNLKQNDC